MPAGRSLRVLLTAVIAAGRRAGGGVGAVPAGPSARGSRCRSITPAAPPARCRWPTRRSGHRHGDGHDRPALRRSGPVGDPAHADGHVPAGAAARTYDVVGVDQRGTGESGAVACRRRARRHRGVRRQARHRRTFFNTPETAHDLENLRVALGVDKLTLLGVSYGAKVAGEYARRYPAHTAAIVLDSPTPVDGLDGVDELRMLGTPRVLREVCFPGLCSATVTDPEEALETAASATAGRRGERPARLARARLHGGVTRVRPVPTLIAASDLEPPLRAGLPAAIASLADGDAAPLLHLVALRQAMTTSATSTSPGCSPRPASRRRLPWAPDSPVASRTDALTAFLAARTDASRRSAPRSCSTTPPPACARSGRRRRARARRLPRARTCPVLVLSGRDDLRTPLEDARRTAAQYPNAKVLAVPGVGHSVLGTDFSGCALNGLIAFLRGAPDRAVLERARANPRRTVRAGDDRRPARRHAAPGFPAGRSARVGVTLTGVGFDAAFAGARPASSRGCVAVPSRRAQSSSCTTSSGSAACASPVGSRRAGGDADGQRVSRRGRHGHVLALRRVGDDRRAVVHVRPLARRRTSQLRR